MQTLNQLRDTILSNIEDVVRYANLSQDEINNLDADAIRDLLDEHSYFAPEVIYYAEAWEIVAGNSFNDYSDYDKGLVDFSSCDSALDCLVQEANAIISEAYSGEFESIANEYLESVQD